MVIFFCGQKGLNQSNFSFFLFFFFTLLSFSSLTSSLSRDGDFQKVVREMAQKETDLRESISERNNIIFSLEREKQILKNREVCL